MMQLEKARHTYFSHRLMIVCGVILFMFTMLFLGKTAHADVTLSPDPGSIPLGIRDYLEISDARESSPSLTGWVARRGFPAQQTIAVPFGTTSINLTYHSIGTVGFSPSSTTRTRYYVQSATNGASGVVGNFNQLVFAPNQNVVGATAWDSINFSFAPVGGFPTSGNYRVTLSTKIINEFSNGSFFRCVANGATAASLSDYTACPTTALTFTIRVNVPPPPVEGCTDSNALNYDPDATVDDGSCIYDLCNNLPGNQSAIPAGYSSNGSGGCVYAAPSCEGNQNLSVAAGLSFIAKKSFKNNNTVSMPISKVVYNIGTNVPTTNASPVSATLTAGSTREFSAQAHTINQPGTYTITWTATFAFGTAICTEDIQVTFVEPTCEAGLFSLGTLEQFVPKVTIRNDNFVAVTVSSATYSTVPSVISGAAQNLSPVAGRGSGTFEAPSTAIPNAGEYTMRWTFDWGIGTTTGTKTCEKSNNLVYNQPYTRFYGNDVFAGGGFGDNCSISGSLDAKGFGSNTTHASYIGTASELAVFAVGQIENVLPGSQRDRSFIQELAFSNNNVPSGQVDPLTGKFGGGFGSISCAHDYYAAAVNADSMSSTTIDVSTLASGSYSFGTDAESTIILTSGSGIPDGRRLVIYVNGNAQISDAGNGRFGFANANGSWGSINEIPTLSVIVSGNIYTQSEVVEMDGVYIAQPRFGDDSSGRIYTCANGVADPLVDVGDRTSASANFIVNNCNKQLTVNGAFIAQRVHLLRSFGTVSDGVAFESYNTPGNHMAEVFKFTPELYLTEGGGLPPRSTNAKIDSILALPPSF